MAYAHLSHFMGLLNLQYTVSPSIPMNYELSPNTIVILYNPTFDHGKYGFDKHYINISADGGINSKCRIQPLRAPNVDPGIRF